MTMMSASTEEDWGTLGGGPGASQQEGPGSLHVLPVFPGVLSGHSGSLPPSEDPHWGTG